MKTLDTTGTPLAKFDLAGYYEGHELDALAQARNYYGWMMGEFGDALRGTILEVGAGVGTLSQLLLQGGCEHLICLEPARNLIPILTRRLQVSSHAPVEIIPGTFEEYSGSGARESLDTIVCINVLEHIEEDLDALREMRRLLRPGGRLCLFVPALPFLYGSLDHAFGHYRRYTKNGLGSLLREAGFSESKLTYFNLPGSFAWLMMGRVLRVKSLSEAPVKWYDRTAIPVIRLAESLVAPPFGQSVLAVAG